MAKPVKKHWVKIRPPAGFKSQRIGDCYVTDAASLVGRTVNVNLMNLNNDPRSQSINLNFEVTGIKEGQAVTTLRSYKISGALIKRLVRRGSSRIDDSFICETKDNFKVRVKPFVLTRTKANGSVASAIRKAVKSTLIKEAKKQAYTQFTESIVMYRVQKELRGSLKKLHPLKACEIRSLSIVKKGTAEKPKEAEKKPADSEKKAVKDAEPKDNAEKEDSNEAGMKKELKDEPKPVKEDITGDKPKENSSETASSKDTV